MSSRSRSKFKTERIHLKAVFEKHVKIHCTFMSSQTNNQNKTKKQVEEVLIDNWYLIHELGSVLW